MTAAANIDLALVGKYNQPAPRYTSYPPANHFIDDLGVVDPAALIAEDNLTRSPLSLYFHLPFCAARCWFCGCTKIITADKDAAAAYLEDLRAEMDLLVPHIAKGRPATQLHLGGGTPTFFPADQLYRLAELVHERFNLAADAEVSVEIDPRHLADDQIPALRALGATRASLGVQDTNHDVQVAVHRVQPMEMNRSAVDRLRANGFTSINVDLIYGLPKQTAETFAQTVEDVLTLRPDRLSVFSYAHIPSMLPAQRIFDKRETQMPSIEGKLRLFELSHKRLIEAGYEYIGLDHYALPGDELARAYRSGNGLHRNFQGYSTRAGASLYGFGISAISSSPNGYWQNVKDLPTYRRFLAEKKLPWERGYRLTEEDHRRRVLIMSIMCERRLDYVALGEKLGCDIAAAYANEIAGLADLEADGIVIRSDSGILVTDIGAPLLRVVAARFDAHLKNSRARHAQAV